jgi:hypothetical protein
MSEFDIHKYKKNQYLAEAGLGSSQAQSLATSIDNAIGGVDDSLSSRDFAIAVSIIIKEKFPSNQGPFMEVLHSELGMRRGLNEETDNKQMGIEFSDKFDVKAFSTNDTLDIRTKENIDGTDFENMIKFVEDKGYTVDRDQSRSDFEHESGERSYYPRIKFTK